MVLIRPVRRGPNGEDVDVKAMWEALEPTTFAAVDISIDQADFAEFEKEYRGATESCHTCHTASGLPHLRPQIPTEAATPILNFDPQATWP
jgi:hypothetical protein